MPTPRFAIAASIYAILAASFNEAFAQPAVAPSTPDTITIEIPGSVVSYPLAPVTLPDGRTLLVGVTEVPWDLYDVFVYALDEPDPARPRDADVVTRPTKPYMNMDRGWGHAGFPAFGMSHRAATAFCAWLSHKTGRTFRLPTSDEFDSLCALASSESATPLGDRAWHAGSADAKTHPVASLAPDALGLHDLAGNVGEWCDGPDAKPIVRGGSYLEPLDQLTCSFTQLPHRKWNATDPQIPKSKWWLSDCTWVGLRVVCDPNTTLQPAPADPPISPDDGSPAPAGS